MGKKSTSILVLVLLLAHLAGFYVYFVVRLGEVRMEMRKQLAHLPDEKLEVILIPQKSFRSAWLEEREMKWGGRMYDIARTEKDGENIRVYCLHDEDEDGLLNFISAIVETSRQDTQQAPDTVVQFFTLKYVTSKVLVPLPKLTRLIVCETPYRDSSISFVADPASPPPRS